VAGAIASLKVTTNDVGHVLTTPPSAGFVLTTCSVGRVSKVTGAEATTLATTRRE
jgi:hypothetical protein